MSNNISDDEKKVDEYLTVVQDRILAPIQRTDIREFCTATLLLLFAAIDGMGKLIHPNAKAGSNERIRSFLDYMGGDYRRCKEELLGLRNSLVHNAINVESFLSHTEMNVDKHLKKMGAAEFIYVNTIAMSRDFIHTFQRFRVEILHDRNKLRRAADRLEWREDNSWDSKEFTDTASPSFPPPIVFIYAK